MSNDKNLSDLAAKFLPPPASASQVSLSLVIPVHNCSEVIGETLESVKRQNYTPLEVIVIDARSADHTLEIVHSYDSLVSRVYTVTDYHVAEMINRGISLASGKYISFLYPGTSYLSPSTFHTFAEQIAVHHQPDLVYCGSIQREIKQEPKTILRPFNPELLKRGQSFATTPACWFRSDLFEKIGKFDTRYTVRSSFELFCRMSQESSLKTALIDRVFVDFDYGRFSYGKMIRFTEETWKILAHHFGVIAATKWWFKCLFRSQ